jgi:hypothetical protein
MLPTLKVGGEAYVEVLRLSLSNSLRMTRFATVMRTEYQLVGERVVDGGQGGGYGGFCAKDELA